MSAKDASFTEMQRLLRRMAAHDQMRLDTRTVDRLLDGTMSSDDAPPRYRHVARAVEVLTGPGTDAELVNEARAVASIATLVGHRPALSSVTRSSMARSAGERSSEARSSVATASRPEPASSGRRLLRLATVSFVGALTLFGGLAAANALPGAVQRVTSDVLEEVGVNIPAPESDATNPPTVDAPTGGVADDPSSTWSGSGFTEPDKTASETGGNHGAIVSAEASNGKSHAGQQGSSSSATHGPPEHSNAGGNGNGKKSTGSSVPTSGQDQP